MRSRIDFKEFLIKNRALNKFIRDFKGPGGRFDYISNFGNFSKEELIANEGKILFEEIDKLNVIEPINSTLIWSCTKHRTYWPELNRLWVGCYINDKFNDQLYDDD